MKNKNFSGKIALIAMFGAIFLAFSITALFSQTSPAPKQEKLLNGLKVLMWSDPRAEKVTVNLRIHAGSSFDPQGREGLMQMLADDLFPNNISKEFFSEDLGGGLEIESNFDFIQINASSRPDALLTMLETLATAVSNPSIDKETTARLRSALLAKVETLEADPAYVADQAVASRLLGTFPYGRTQYGTAATLQKIDFADLLDAKQRFLTADNATIAISGNFDRSQAFRAIRRYFGGWLKADKRVPSTFRQPADPPPGILNLPTPKPGNGAIRFALRGVARSDREFAASLIYTRVFENRLKMRVPAAHAGDLFVRNDAHILPGIIIVGFTVTKDEFGAGNGKIDGLDLIAKSLSDPVTDAEFQTAKNAVRSDWAKRDIVSLWLDTDTFKTTSADTYARVVDNTNLSDVGAYAETVRRLPIAAVQVNTPTKTD
jgi:hypothetical protein